MKTRLALALCVIVIMHTAAKSQVKIGDNATTINSASLLELETTNKGFVLPRVSLTNVSSSSPLATGLLTGTVVYNTNSGTTGGSGIGIYYWDASKWNFLTNTTFTGNYWSLTGNSGTNASTNFIGTTDAKDFVVRTNNVERMNILGATVGSSQAGWIGMGIATTPKSALDVAGNYSGKNVITIQNTSTTGFSSVDMLDNAGNLATTFGFANSGTGTAFSGKAYLNGYGNDFLFTRGSSYDLIMKGSNGYVGLNTSTPSERLHVVGNIYLSGAFMPGGDAGTTGYILTSAGTNTSPTWTNTNSLAWRLTGNSGTNASTNFIGTTDAVDFVARTNNAERLRITSAGNVGVGIANPAYKLAVLSTSNPLYLSGVQATSTLSTDSVLTINAGVVKKTPYSSFGTSTTNALNLSGNTLTSTVNGIPAISNAVSGVSNASSANTLSTTVNGITGTGVSIINSNNKTWTQAGGLTTTVNGVSSNITPASGTIANILGYSSTGAPVYQPASGILGGLTTNALNLSGNTLTSTVNGIPAISNAVSGVSNASSANTLSTTVNGITGTGVSIINSNNKTWTQAGGLTTTVNGISSNITPASGTIANILGYSSTGAPVYQSLSNVTLNSAWNLIGNTGLDATKFIGTTDNISMRFRTNNVQRMIIDSVGNVGIGTTKPLNALSVFAASNPLYLSGVQATSTFNTDSVLTINAGIVKKTPFSSLTGNFWGLTGNSGTDYSTNFLGTTDNVSLRFRTNNIEQMLLDSLGTLSVGYYGASSFNTDNPPKLSVDYSTTTSNTIAYMRGSIDSYLQMNLRNKSNGSNASTDYVATADDGTDSTNYVDLGINSSNYAPSVENFGGPHDAYLYAYSRNLIIGTQKASSDIIFLLGGGVNKTNSVLRLDGATGNLILGRGDNQPTALGNTLRGPNGGNGTNIAGGSLTLQGGSSNGNTAGGNLNLYGGGTVSGTLGSVNINTSTNSATNINTGTSTGTVTIGNSLNNINLPKLSATSVVLTDGSKNLTSTTPANNTYLYYNGTNFTWATAATLNSFSVTAPLTYNNLTGVFGITKANTITDGYLSSIDWNTFNNKVGGITLNTPSSIFDNPLNFSVSSGIATGTLSLNTQAQNTVFAGPVSGVAAIPTFRALVAADLPSLADNYIQNQTIQQSSSNFNISGNGTIGGILTVTGKSQLNGGVTNKGILTTTGGIVNINNNSNFAANINTGTSTGNITIGNSGNNILFPKFNTAGGIFFTSATTGQIANTGTDMNWDDVNNRLGIGITNPSYKLSVVATSDPLYLSGVQATSTFSSDSVLTINAGVVKKTPFSSFTGNFWGVTGNSGTTAGTNFIGTTDAVDLVTKTNNTERIRITSSGNIGVGTNNPQQSLSINNGVNIDQSSGNTGSTVNALTFGSSSGEGVGSKRTSGGNQYGLDFYTAYNNRMVITNDGNVGIGLTNPSYKLAVLSSSNPLYLSGVQETSTFSSDSILTIYNGVVKKTSYSSLPGSVSGWSLSGNAAASGNFLGTTNTTPLQFKFNSTNAGYLDGNNTSFGTSSSSTTGSSNTAIGYSATASNSATAVGANSAATLANTTAIGNNAKANSSSQATAIGASSQALLQNNTAVGYNAQATSSSQETVIGASALAQGQNNIAIGYSAKANNSNQITAIGSSAQASFQNNTVVGYNALAIVNNQATAIGASSEAGAQNATALGYNSTASGTNSTAIGYNATTSQNNALVLGTSTTNVGIGTSTPNTSTKLDVTGSFKLGSSGSVLSNFIKTTVSIDPGTMSAGSTVTSTTTITGAAVGNSVIINPRSALPAGVLIAYSYISAANTLTVVFTSAVSADPPATTFDITLIQ